MMTKFFQLMLSATLTLATFSLVGCGPSGDATYDPSAVPEYTEADEQAAEDYEAQMEKEFQEQYGN